MDTDRKFSFPAADTILNAVVIGGLATLFGLAMLVPAVAVIA